MEVGRLASGTLFAARYRLERLLKEGGMGAVYVAVHTQTLRRVALKLMRPDIVANEDARARFAQEAQVASMIDSAFVVDVLDAGVDTATNIPFLAMELLVGRELGDLVADRGRVEPKEVVHWLGQVARALDRAHARGVVHRDLKPENLFLATRDDEPPKIKILDFGIAKITANAARRTTRGAGTPLYMAPEQTRRSADIGPATDVWALGLIAYTLLVGRQFWEGDDIHQLYGEILAGEYDRATVRAAQHGVTLPAPFDGWFSRCVARDPAARFSVASDAIAALAVAFDLPFERPAAQRSITSSEPTPLVPLVTTQPPVLATMEMRPEDAPDHAPRVIERTEIVTPSPQRTVPASVGPPPSSRSSIEVEASSTTAPESPLPYSAQPGRTRAKMVAAGVAFVAFIAFVWVRVGSRKEDAEPPTPATTMTAKAVATIAPATTSPAATAGGLAPKGVKTLDDHIAQMNPWITSAGRRVHQHEVTRQEYALFLAGLTKSDKARRLPRSDWDDVDPAIGDAGAPVMIVPVITNPGHPVTWVTHEDATAFCAAIHATLPSPADWKAVYEVGFAWTWPPPATGVALARGDVPVVHWASSLADRTKDGVHDLVGNALEWVGDATDGFAELRGGDVSMSLSDALDSIKNGRHKMTATAAGSGAQPKQVADARIGFRCARPL